MVLRHFECCKQCSNYPNEGCESPNICRACCDGSEFTAKSNPFRQQTKQTQTEELSCRGCWYEGYKFSGCIKCTRYGEKRQDLYLSKSTVKEGSK